MRFNLGSRAGCRGDHALHYALNHTPGGVCSSSQAFQEDQSETLTWHCPGVFAQKMQALECILKIAFKEHTDWFDVTVCLSWLTVQIIVSGPVLALLDTHLDRVRMCASAESSLD